MNFRAPTLRCHTEPLWGPKVGLPTAFMGGLTAGRNVCCPMKPLRLHASHPGRAGHLPVRTRDMCVVVRTWRRSCVGRLGLGPRLLRRPGPRRAI